MSFGKSITRLFKESINLNYSVEDVDYILLGSKGRFRNASEREYYEWDVKIEDRNAIEKTINFLNALELIDETPKGVGTYRHINDLNDVGYFAIEIIGINYEDDNTDVYSLGFMKDQVSVLYGIIGSRSLLYYIKDSGYNNRTKSSHTYEFLYSLVND